MPLLEQPVGGIVDAVMLVRVVRGLGLEHDDAHVPGREVAALLDRLEQLEAVEMAVAEVPAVDDVGDQFTLAHVVGLDVVDRAIDEAVERAAVAVHGAERQPLVEQQLGEVAVAVDLRELLDDDAGGLLDALVRSPRFHWKRRSATSGAKRSSAKTEDLEAAD